MKTIQEFDKEHTEFGKMVLSLISQLQPYVKHRLYFVETTGIMPHDMCKSTGIIDDAMVTLYKNYEGKIKGEEALKLKIFSLVSERLILLFKKESFHKNTMSTNDILNREIEKLEEIIEMNISDGLHLKGGFDDISYHQSDFQQPNFLYSDAEKNIIQSLEIHDDRQNLSEDHRIILNKIYSWLPLETSDRLDLFVFGNLSYDEIAQIKETHILKLKR
ncbi:MAG: hypothetical protein ACI9SJ_000234 [Flavobacteriaceae bacterium]|jgi:hypothetical protein|uniref:hypothetical protein n=1 Tax=Candidatus Marifrigoribacter sp. Uisw_064 TaxID=3230970 RepID=UPI003AEBCA34